jgi:hypothetical protein
MRMGKGVGVGVVILRNGEGKACWKGSYLGGFDMDVNIITIRLNGFLGKVLYLTSFIPAEGFV